VIKKRGSREADVKLPMGVAPLSIVYAVAKPYHACDVLSFVVCLVVNSGFWCI